jgi:hypothetical protein
MKTFSEFFAAKEAAYGQFSTPGEINTTIQWDEKEQAWYDQNGWPFDDEFMHQFLTQQGQLHKTQEFEVHIEFTSRGHHYPASGMNPDSYDDQRHATGVHLYAHGNTVVMPPNVAHFLLDHFSNHMDRAKLDHQPVMPR